MPGDVGLNPLLLPEVGIEVANLSQQLAVPDLIQEWFATIGDRLPSSLRDELHALEHRLY